MWRKREEEGEENEGNGGRERGEERTDSCGLHASTTREESEGEKERGEKLDLLSEWRS